MTINANGEVDNQSVTHLFEEPGALERVAELASQWFHLHIATKGARETTIHAPR
jgi:hypothetical protein